MFLNLSSILLRWLCSMVLGTVSEERYCSQGLFTEWTKVPVQLSKKFAALWWKTESPTNQTL